MRFQFNNDHGDGPLDGDKTTLNIQPVIPISLNADWKLISRTILPVTWQDDITGPSGTQFGLGDTVQRFVLSPAKPGTGYPFVLFHKTEVHELDAPIVGSLRVRRIYWPFLADADSEQTVWRDGKRRRQCLRNRVRPLLA